MPFKKPNLYKIKIVIFILEMNSEVLKGIISNTAAVQENTAATRVDEPVSQTQQTDPFSPQVSGTSDSTVESTLSKIALTLNTNGTIDADIQVRNIYRQILRRCSIPSHKSLLDSKAGQVIFNIFKNIFDFIQGVICLGKLPVRDETLNFRIQRF